MEKERTIIVKEKSDNGALKVATLVAIVATSPFWLVLGVVLIGCVTGMITESGPWPYVALLMVCLFVTARDRISGRHNTVKLQDQLHKQEMEAMELRMQVQQLQDSIIHLQETIEFDQKLKLSSQEQKPATTGGASQGQLVEVGSRSDK